MSNLGLYQMMTTVAKRVGGPLRFLGIVAAGGYVVLRPLETAGKWLVKKLFVGKSTDDIKGKVFSVTTEGADEQGLAFKVGDKFKVWEYDKDSILIEKIGDSNNPYFVSAQFLRSISDLPA